MGLSRTMRAILPAMRRKENGLIVNIGLILGRATFPYLGSTARGMAYAGGGPVPDAMVESFPEATYPTTTSARLRRRTARPDRLVVGAPRARTG